MTGERIRALRETNGMTQEELAQIIGMSQNTVARWEREELAPRGTSLAKLAKALNTTSTYLLDETDNPAPQTRKPNNDPPAQERSVVEKNRGNLMYTFKDGEQLVLPDTDRGYELFREILMQKAVMA